MTNRKPKIAVEMGNLGILIKMAESDTELEVDLPLSEASKLLLALGFGMNAALAQKLGKIEDPGRSMNVITPTANMITVTTHEGKTYLNIRFSDFPTMRLEVPEDILKSTGEALIQIATTPADIRDQRAN